MNKMSKKKKIFLIVDLVLAILLVALDQLTKQLACEYLQDKPAIVLINRVYSKLLTKDAKHTEKVRKTTA